MPYVKQQEQNRNNRDMGGVELPELYSRCARVPNGN